MASCSQTSTYPDPNVTVANLPSAGEFPSYQIAIIVCAATTSFVATIFVGLRIFTRWFMLHLWGWEDWMMVLALLFGYAMSEAFIHEALLGLGEQSSLVPPQNRIPLGMVGWLGILWYALSLMCAQMSVLLLYIRVMGSDRMRRACYVTLAVVMVFNVWVVVYIFTACVPLEAFWDPRVHGQCYPEWLSPFNTVLHIVSDLVIFLLPFPAVRHLRMPPRQKSLLFCIFGLGFFVCIVSSIRFIYLMQFNNGDFTFADLGLVYWTCVETNTAIVVACCMTLKPFVTRYLSCLLGQRRSPTEPTVTDEAGVEAAWPQPQPQNLPKSIRRNNFPGWSAQFGTEFDMTDDKMSGYLTSRDSLEKTKISDASESSR